MIYAALLIGSQVVLALIIASAFFEPDAHEYRQTPAKPDSRY
ncbi:hypothetical protein ACKC9G_06515 [Pokkaliibacter sp. CJK22405]